MTMKATTRDLPWAVRQAYLCMSLLPSPSLDSSSFSNAACSTCALNAMLSSILELPYRLQERRVGPVGLAWVSHLGIAHRYHPTPQHSLKVEPAQGMSRTTSSQSLRRPRTAIHAEARCCCEDSCVTAFVKASAIGTVNTGCLFSPSAAAGLSVITVRTVMRPSEATLRDR